MAVWSIIGANVVDADGRWDAEYFSPDNLRLAARLDACGPCRVADFADVTDGIHASPEWAESGVRYLSAKCVREHVVELDAAGRISVAQDEANPRTRARTGDIVITSVGTIGNAAVVEDWMLPANMDRHLGIIRIRPGAGVDPYYLATFLNCRFGRFQSVRESTGNVQLNLFIEKIRGIKVPLTSDVQESVGKVARTACAELRAANLLYPSAEAEMLERLGWAALSRKPVELSYVQDFDSLTKAERTDAEFFQPQYARLRAALVKRGAVSLGRLVRRFDKGTQPNEYRDDGEVVVVKSKQVTGRGVDLGACERAGSATYTDESARLSSGDVVMNSTGRGTLGRAAVIPSHRIKVVAAVDLVIARLLQDAVDPDYLALFLNSPAGIAQSEQFQTGSSGQLHLYPQHFSQFLVFLPRDKNGAVDLAWQRSLAAKVQAAAAAKQEARKMLDEAKRIVEQAIMDA